MPAWHEKGKLSSCTCISTFMPDARHTHFLFLSWDPNITWWSSPQCCECLGGLLEGTSEEHKDNGPPMPVEKTDLSLISILVHLTSCVVCAGCPGFGNRCFSHPLPCLLKVEMPGLELGSFGMQNMFPTTRSQALPTQIATIATSTRALSGRMNLWTLHLWN